MRRDFTRFNYWMVLAVLLLGVAGLGQAQQAQVKVICDKDGQEIYLDGEFKTTCDSGEPVRVIVPPGKHVVEAKRVNDDGSFFYFKKEFKIGGGVQKVIEVESEISYTPEYYQKRCDSGSIDGCFFYLNAEKKEPYWETAKLKYFELLCDKGSVRGCAYLHSIGKLSADEFREAADRRLTELYAKDPNAKSELAKELLKYKVYLVDPEFYTYDIDYARKDGAEMIRKATVSLAGAYYAPVALYLDKAGGGAYYLLEGMGIPGRKPNLSDPLIAPASLAVSLSGGGTYKAAVAAEPKKKLGEYETVLIAGRLDAEFAKSLAAQAHNLALMSESNNVLAQEQGVVFVGVATYSEDYLYQRATRTGDPAIYWAYLQLYPNGKYVQVVRRGLRELEAAQEKAAYEACKNASEPTPCLQYLNKYPNGAHKQLAASRFMELSCSAGSARACLEQERQAAAWRSLKDGLLEAIESYYLSQKEVARKKFSDRVDPPTFGPDGRYLAVRIRDYTLCVYRTSDWAEVTRKEFDIWVYSPTFSPDGQYLAARIGDNTLRVVRPYFWTTFRQLSVSPSPPSENFSANASGVRYPRAEWGRLRL